MRMKQLKRLQGPRRQVLHLCQQCPLKIHRQNQLQLRECQKFQFSDGLKNFNFPRWNMAQGRNPRFATRYILNDGTMTQEAHDALLRKAAQAFNNRDVDREIEAVFKGRKKHMNEVSRSGKHELQPNHFQIIKLFHVVHLQQELRLCVHSLKSMQHFVKVIPLWLHIHNQSSRRLHRLREDRCHQASTLTKNLQGLVPQCSLHHQRHHLQMQLKD